MPTAPSAQAYETTVYDGSLDSVLSISNANGVSYRMNVLPYDKEEEAMVSVWARAAGGENVDVSINALGTTSVQNVKVAWTRLKMRVEHPSTNYVTITPTSDDVLYFYKCMVEAKANHESEWVPAPEDMDSDVNDLSESIGTVQDSADIAMKAVQSLSVGGENLIDNSETISITGTSSNTYLTLAEGLLPGTVYTLSFGSATRVSGNASGMSLELMRYYTDEGGSIVEECDINQFVPGYDTSEGYRINAIDFSDSKISQTFVTPNRPGTYSLRIYAGNKGATSNVTVLLKEAQLEQGTFATMWTESKSDLVRRLESIQTSLDILKTGVTIATTRVIGNYRTNEETGVIEVLDANDNWVPYINGDNVDEQMSTIQDFFEFDTSTAGNPVLRIRTQRFDGGTAAANQMYMELTKSRLSFHIGGKEVAYFSDQKLWVDTVQPKQMIVIGEDSTTQYLKIFSSAGGVAFTWASTL